MTCPRTEPQATVTFDIGVFDGGDPWSLNRSGRCNTAVNETVVELRSTGGDKPPPLPYVVLIDQRTSNPWVVPPLLAKSFINRVREKVGNQFVHVLGLAHARIVK